MSGQERLSVKPPSLRQPDIRSSDPWQIAWATVSRPAGALTGLLILGLIFAEILSPTVRRLSSGYPLTTSFIGTFISLAFIANVVNQIVTKRLQVRWERVRSIAMQGMNDEIRVVRDILHVIEYGEAPFEDTLPIVATTEQRVPAAIRVTMNATLTSASSAAPVAELVCLGAWVLFARVGLSEASANLRVGLARWSPLLSMGAEVSDASHSMIVNSAYLADAVSVLELPLAEARLEQGVPPPNVRTRFVDLWEIVAAAFVFVEEASANALRPSLDQPPGRVWKSAMRTKLSRSSAGWLDRWDRSKISAEAFQEDLVKARDGLEALQIDFIYLTPSGKPDLASSV